MKILHKTIVLLVTLVRYSLKDQKSNKRLKMNDNFISSLDLIRIKMYTNYNIFDYY